MENVLIFPAGTGEAVFFAQKHLHQHHVRLIDHPAPEVTHLLLDTPTKELPTELLKRLPENITIIGGMLKQPELNSYVKLDLLQHEPYLAKNAAITAECALQVAAEHRKSVFSGADAMVIGWGRIGKCLASLLRHIGCSVTVCARKVSDRALLEALGFRAANPQTLTSLNRFSLIFNTVPVPILSKAALSQCTNTLKIDLASQQGLICNDVIWARGLPGKYAPESSGKLIAEIILKEVSA